MICQISIGWAGAGGAIVRRQSIASIIARSTRASAFSLTDASAPRRVPFGSVILMAPVLSDLGAVAGTDSGSRSGRRATVRFRRAIPQHFLWAAGEAGVEVSYFGI